MPSTEPTLAELDANPELLRQLAARALRADDWARIREPVFNSSI